MLVNKVKSFLGDMPTNCLVEVYNEFAEENYYEMVIDLFCIDFNELFLDPNEAVKLTNHKDFDDRHRFAFFNGLGYLESFNNVETSPIDTDALALWIVEKDLFERFGIEVEAEQCEKLYR